MAQQKTPQDVSESLQSLRSRTGNVQRRLPMDESEKFGDTKTGLQSPAYIETYPELGSAGGSRYKSTKWGKQ